MVVSAGTAHPTQTERERICHTGTHPLTFPTTPTLDTGKGGWYVQSAQDVRKGKVVYVHIESLAMGPCKV